MVFLNEMIDVNECPALYSQVTRLNERVEENVERNDRQAAAYQMASHGRCQELASCTSSIIAQSFVISCFT